MGQICQAHVFPSPSLPCVVTVAKLATAPLAHARAARLALLLAATLSPPPSPLSLSLVHMPPRPRRLSLPTPPACERSPPLAMAASRTSTPSRRPSSPRPLPIPESACSRPNEAPGPGHHLQASPERRRSGTVPLPAAACCGTAATDHLLALQGHLQVRADLLSLLHPSLAAG